MFTFPLFYHASVLITDHFYILPVVSSTNGSCLVHLDLVQLGQFGNKVFILG